MRRLNPRIRLPRFLNRCFPSAIWRASVETKEVFLTFDDGPVPEVTPWVLDLLKKEDIKACFFCVGENVKRHPDVYRWVLREGHQVGNHTFNHLQGLKTKDPAFLSNVEKASQYINSCLFRPPHGWMRRSQYEQLSLTYTVVMWDIISGDYRKELTPKDVIKNVLKTVRPGSIIVFHDSIKAQKNLEVALPVIIRKLKRKGYSFGKLTENNRQMKMAI